VDHLTNNKLSAFRDGIHCFCAAANAVVAMERASRSAIDNCLSGSSCSCLLICLSPQHLLPQHGDLLVESDGLYIKPRRTGAVGAFEQIEISLHAFFDCKRAEMDVWNSLI